MEVMVGEDVEKPASEAGRMHTYVGMFLCSRSHSPGSAGLAHHQFTFFSPMARHRQILAPIGTCLTQFARWDTFDRGLRQKTQAKKARHSHPDASGLDERQVWSLVLTSRPTLPCPAATSVSCGGLRE